MASLIPDIVNGEPTVCIDALLSTKGARAISCYSSPIQ